MDLQRYSFSLERLDSGRNDRYKGLRNDTLFTDVTLVCNDDKQIQAHKVILSSFSSLFKRMFSNNPHPQPLVFLKGVEIDDIDAILDFIYQGEASVEQDNFNTFLETAMDLEIEELSSFSEAANSKIKLGFIQKEFKPKDKVLNQNTGEKILETEIDDQIKKGEFKINKYEECPEESFGEVDVIQYSELKTREYLKDEHEYELVSQVKSGSYLRKKLEDPNLFDCSIVTLEHSHPNK